MVRSKLARRIENANLNGTEARAALRIVDRVIFLREYRLNAGASKTFQPQQCGLISISIIASR
jgi:hypothetical protein